MVSIRDSEKNVPLPLEHVGEQVLDMVGERSWLFPCGPRVTLMRSAVMMRRPQAVRKVKIAQPRPILGACV
jgi:hypothetical protein